MISYEVVDHIPRVVKQCMSWASRLDCAYMRMIDQGARLSNLVQAVFLDQSFCFQHSCLREAIALHTHDAMRHHRRNLTVLQSVRQIG